MGFTKSVSIENNDTMLPTLLLVISNTIRIRIYIMQFSCQMQIQANTKVMI